MKLTPSAHKSPNVLQPLGRHSGSSN